jgi:hypothetical protein
MPRCRRQGDYALVLHSFTGLTNIEKRFEWHWLAKQPRHRFRRAMKDFRFVFGIHGQIRIFPNRRRPEPKARLDETIVPFRYCRRPLAITQPRKKRATKIKLKRRVCVIKRAPEREEEAPAPPKRISGIGDETFCFGSRMSGALYVLQKEMDVFSSTLKRKNLFRIYRSVSFPSSAHPELTQFLCPEQSARIYFALTRFGIRRPGTQLRRYSKLSAPLPWFDRAGGLEPINISALLSLKL